MSCKTGREVGVEFAVQFADLGVAVQEDELDPDLVRFLYDRLGARVERSERWNILSGERWKVLSGDWREVEGGRY